MKNLTHIPDDYIYYIQDIYKHKYCKYCEKNNIIDKIKFEKTYKKLYVGNICFISFNDCNNKLCKYCIMKYLDNNEFKIDILSVYCYIYFEDLYDEIMFLKKYIYNSFYHYNVVCLSCQYLFADISPEFKKDDDFSSKKCCYEYDIKNKKIICLKNNSYSYNVDNFSSEKYYENNYISIKTPMTFFLNNNICNKYFISPMICNNCIGLNEDYIYIDKPKFENFEDINIICE